MFLYCFFFFFKQKTAYEIKECDWSSDVCSSDLIYPNVDFYSGIVYERMGIPTDFYTPIFVMARTVGWLAHWREQLSGNRIFRPTQIYIGEHGKKYIPVDQR